MKIAESDLYKEYLARASDCVRDQADVDFAAPALYLSNKFRKVILLTWNKRIIEMITLKPIEYSYTCHPIY